MLTLALYQQCRCRRARSRFSWSNTRRACRVLATEGSRPRTVAASQAVVTDMVVLSCLYPDLDVDAPLQDELAMAGEATGNVTVDAAGVLTAFQA